MNKKSKPIQAYFRLADTEAEKLDKISERNARSRNLQVKAFVRDGIKRSCGKDKK